MIKRLNKALFNITISLLIVLLIGMFVMWAMYGIAWAIIFSMLGTIVALPFFILFSIVNLYVTYQAVRRNVVQEKEV